MIGCSNFLLISRIVTRRMERRWCISIITVTWKMGNANQMVSSESCLALAALPRDHRSEFGSLSQPWYSMGTCYWHPWTVVRALGTTSQPPVVLQPALGLRLHPVPARSPPFFNSMILWVLLWRNEEFQVPSATTQKLRKDCECS